VKHNSGDLLEDVSISMGRRIACRIEVARGICDLKRTNKSLITEPSSFEGKTIIKTCKRCGIPDTGWTPGVLFPAEQEIFLFSTAPRQDLGPTYPYIQYVQVVSSM
jgi:hypothetical protein